MIHFPTDSFAHQPTNKPKFQINQLTLTIPSGLTVLKNITLTIPVGQITCLIGPSGSGKSTLLRCLNRLLEPPTNTIFLDETDITQREVLALRRQVGMVFQQAALFEGTVADNIAYGPSLFQQTISAERLTDLLRMVNLPPDIATKSAQTLSGGQAQRVSLARTLANEPEVLLLDEPTSALDPAATRHIEKSVQTLRDKFGLTVVWVSHAIEQVQRIADYVGLLVDGDIVETGVPEHLFSGEHSHLTEAFVYGNLASQQD